MARGAREALKLGSFDIAQSLAREILALDATHAEAKVSLGRALFYTKEYAQAAEMLAAGLQPDAQLEVWIELARAREKIRQWPDAIDAFAP